MASTDICEYMTDIVLDFDYMTNYELNRIWDEGLRIIESDGFEFVAYPFKGDAVPEVIAIAPYENKLTYYRWKNPDMLDEVIVKELKRIGFSAPWVDGWEVKDILIAKWGKIGIKIELPLPIEAYFMKLPRTQSPFGFASIKFLSTVCANIF